MTCAFHLDRSPDSGERTVGGGLIPKVNREVGLNCGDLTTYRRTGMVMRDQFQPAAGSPFAAEGPPEHEMEMLLFTYPGLDGLEPYYIEWEFIWPM